MVAVSQGLSKLWKCPKQGRPSRVSSFVSFASSLWHLGSSIQNGVLKIYPHYRVTVLPTSFLFKFPELSEILSPWWGSKGFVGFFLFLFVVCLYFT